MRTNSWRKQSHEGCQVLSQKEFTHWEAESCAERGDSEAKRRQAK